MAAQGRQIGEVTIARAVEMIMPFDPAVFFPETTPADWAPHESWLEPDAMDPAERRAAVPGAELSGAHAAPHDPDRCLRRQPQGAAEPPAVASEDRRRLPAGARRARGRARGHRLRDVHPPARRPRRLEHAARGRPLGPDLPQRALRVHAARSSTAWQGGHEKFSRAPLEDSVLPVIAAGQAELVSNDFALDDQVSLEPTPGHTPDHVAIRLASRGQRAVFSGDLMHSPIQCLHPEWTAWPDWDAAQAKRTRRELPGALLRHRHADLHGPLPAAVGRPDRRAGRRLPLRLRGRPLVTPRLTRPPQASSRLPKRRQRHPAPGRRRPEIAPKPAPAFPIGVSDGPARAGSAFAGHDQHRHRSRRRSRTRSARRLRRSKILDRRRERCEPVIRTRATVCARQRSGQGRP